jgi:predicted CopG family antitoxin
MDLLKIFAREDSISELLNKLTEPEKESIRAALCLIVDNLADEDNKKTKDEIKKLESKLIPLSNGIKE